MFLYFIFLLRDNEHLFWYKLSSWRYQRRPKLTIRGIDQILMIRLHWAVENLSALQGSVWNMKYKITQ